MALQSRQLSAGRPVQYPDFFIVGAAKSGTTSLYHYLSQHPSIFMPSVKEPHFFADIKPDPSLHHMIRRVSTDEDYQTLFSGAGAGQLKGEASPSYLWDVGAARRIHACCPDARIIILLRDPVERAYSHYLMDVREGLQHKGFLEALREDMAIPEKSWGSAPGHLYVELGSYADHVRQYLDCFDHSQIFIGMFSDLKCDPAAFTATVLEFLGVDREGLEQIDFSEEHNAYAAPRGGLSRFIMGQGWLRRLIQRLFPQVLRRWLKRRLLLKQSAKPAMDVEAAALLARIYAPDLQRLERLLGRPLPTLWGEWAQELPEAYR